MEIIYVLKKEKRENTHLSSEIKRNNLAEVLTLFHVKN